MSYGLIAGLHEAMGHAYSGGQIRQAKALQAQRMRAGERILYAGGGAGEGAVMAATKGCEVTLIDSDAEMVARATSALADRGAEILCEDVRHHDRPGHYDAVCANFFLSSFDAEQMPVVLAHLVRQLSSDGRLLIADFARSGGAVQRLVQHAYHAIPMVMYAALAGTPLHPLYDYEPHLEATGMAITEREPLRVFRGPQLFESLTARRR